jgi:7-cyano-7-deazaguanine reductase
MRHDWSGGVYDATIDTQAKGAAMSDNFRDILETFENQFPQRDYTIEIRCPEFTSVCPKTGQPDFGVLTFTYTPANRCVELRSLKLYLQQFRNEGIFYEHVTNRILEDLVAVLAPRRMTLHAAFTPRGGITTSVTVTHEAPSGARR